MRIVSVVCGLLVLVLAASIFWIASGCGGAVSKQYRPQGEVKSFDNSDWQKVLDAAVTDDGYVKYDVLTSNQNGTKDALLRYCGLINTVAPHNKPELFATDADELAYYVNAYNALCMYGILQKNLPSNVKDSGIFLLSFFPVGGQSVNLDSLEKKWVRAAGDPRVHFALNCMSTSCPPLRKEPYSGPKLNDQLNDQGRKYLSDPRGAVRDGDKVKLGEIFKFYEKEFIDAYKKQSGKQDANLLEAIQQYAGPDSPVKGATGYSYMKYDWSLNRAR